MIETLTKFKIEDFTNEEISNIVSQDVFETKEEYIERLTNRIPQLNYLEIGNAILNKENYQIEKNLFKLTLNLDDWAKVFIESDLFIYAERDFAKELFLENSEYNLIGKLEYALIQNNEIVINLVNIKFVRQNEILDVKGHYPIKGEKLPHYLAEKSPISKPCFNAEGTAISYVTYDGAVKVYNLVSDNVTRKARLNHIHESNRSMGFTLTEISSDLIYAAFAERIPPKNKDVLEIVELNSGKVIMSHKAENNIGDFKFSPDNKYIVWYEYQYNVAGAVRLYNIDEQKLLTFEFPEHQLLEIVFSPDSSALAVILPSGSAYISNLNTSLFHLKLIKINVLNAIFSSCGNYLILGTEVESQLEVLLFDIKDNKEILKQKTESVDFYCAIPYTNAVMTRDGRILDIESGVIMKNFKKISQPSINKNGLLLVQNAEINGDNSDYFDYQWDEEKRHGILLYK